MLNARLIISVILSIILFANGLTLFAENGKGMINTADFNTPYGTVYTDFK